MQAARRLYLYAMSGITLGVVASGLVLLLRVVLDGLLPGSYDNGYNASGRAGGGRRSACVPRAAAP